jgi:hypothetical protein
VHAEALPPGYGIDDGAGLLFAGTELVEAVSARPSSGAFWVEEIAGELHEVALDLVALEAPADPTPLSIAEFREMRAAGL